MLLLLPVPLWATAFFETGQVTVTDTVDNNGWQSVSFQKTYTSPVIIAGPISHVNDRSLSVRIRNVSASGFEIGMQSPCQSIGGAAITCPTSWSTETIQWLAIEQGTWVFPDGTEVEAYIHNTSTIRSRFGGNSNNSDLINFSRTYAQAPAVLHTVNSFNDTNWISSSAWGPTGGRGGFPSTTGFRLALEGAEAVTSHGTEDIGWLAIERGNGTNNGNSYAAGRTAGRDVDRHNDECENINYGITFSALPNVLAQHNTMSGGDGGWVRSCVPIAPDTGTPIQTNQFFVHMDEDQVNDTDRTGVPEMVAFFAFEQASWGVLEFLTATKSVTDEDSDGVVGPGELLTYTVTITNQQDDFAQLDNPVSTAPEFIDPLDSNVEFESIISPTDGSLVFDATDSRIEWNGTVPASGTVTLQYRVRVRDLSTVCSLSDIPNQGQLNMDPIDDDVESGDIDNLNTVSEPTDDLSRDDGVDSDQDGSTDDDDQTLASVNCLSNVSVSKDDSNINYTPGTSGSYSIIVRNGGPHNLVGAIVNDVLPNGLTLGTLSCTVTGSGSCGSPTVVGNSFSYTINLAADDFLTITVPVTYSPDPVDY